MTTSSSATRSGAVKDRRAMATVAPEAADARRERGRRVAALVAIVVTAAASGCDGDVVHVGRFHGDGTTTTTGSGDGGAGPSTTSVGGPSTGGGGPGGPDAGVGGSEQASSSTGAPAYPDAYREACTALCERSKELRAETECPPMSEDDDDCSTPLRWDSSWGFCESEVGLPPECLEALAPVIACYAASVEARDCFCEFECSYFPACDALFEPPSSSPFGACSWFGDGVFGGEACGPQLGPCVEGKYCDYSDDLCGQGEIEGRCRPNPNPGYPSPWDDVCGCDGQRYPDLVDALAAGVDIGPQELCDAGEGGAGAGLGGAGP